MSDERVRFDELEEGGCVLEIGPARQLKQLARRQAGDAVSYGLAGGLAVVFLGLFGGMMWTKRYTRDLLGTVIENLTFTLPASVGLGVPVGLAVFGVMLAGAVWQRRGLLAGDRLVVDGERLESLADDAGQIRAADETIVDIHPSRLTDAVWEQTLADAERFEVTIVTDADVYAVGTGLDRPTCQKIADRLQRVVFDR
jgi:hypothetical protein